MTELASPSKLLLLLLLLLLHTHQDNNNSKTSGSITGSGKEQQAAPPYLTDMPLKGHQVFVVSLLQLGRRLGVVMQQLRVYSQGNCSPALAVVGGGPPALVSHSFEQLEQVDADAVDLVV
jgi:hypothetical protein